MCCFTGKMDYVGRTSIFARPLSDGRQILIYSMRIAASRELAMVLPIPVSLGIGDDAVRFHDLSGYPKIFEDIERAFPQPLSRGPVAGFGPPQPADLSAKLIVHEVGDFEASYVPTVSDFARLDARFRLPEGVWAKLPEHRTYGFVVVKLRKDAAPMHVHPIAFDFPRRDLARIFFPTLHVHDGEVHPNAEFDHSLYAQGVEATDFGRSADVLGTFVDEKRAKGLVDATAPASKLRIHGLRGNTDVWV